MDVIEAILARTSVRDFSPKPVPKETVMKIFEAAIRSPSGGNAQPWEVFVAAGPCLERIRRTYQERYKAGTGASAPPASPQAPGGPPPQPPYIQQRMATIRNERLRLLGLDPADPASGRVFMDWGARMFGIPVLAVVCMDKALSSNLDIGLFVQTVCLAAQGYGVESFIAGALVSHRDVLRRELGIPEDLNIVTGIGLGYPTPGALINTYRSPRRPLSEVVRYRD
jgi:nitroreductase